MKQLYLDPRTKLFLILLCVLSAMFAPNLYFQFALVAVIGLLAALCGKWQYALRGILAYALICAFTVWCMDNLSGVSTRVVMLVTEGIFSTAVMTLAVFLFDWRVGLLIVAGLAVYYFVNRAMQAKSEQTTRRKLAGDTAVVERVLEHIRGIAEVKSYSLTGKYNRSLEAVIEENVDSNIDMELKLLPLMLAQNVVAKLIDVGVVVLSLILYTSGRMELLNCVMLCICSFLLTEGLEQAGTQSSLLRVVDTCVNQATDILNLPAMDISGAELRPDQHNLCAENIRFSYGERSIINGITLDIPEKSTTAIVGPSGGGKTTLCHLLSRFWDVDGGRVTLADATCGSTIWTA